jgi:hypothetical protein
MWRIIKICHSPELPQGPNSFHNCTKIDIDGYLKGKSAIHIARTYGGKRRNFVGEHFSPRG